MMRHPESAWPFEEPEQLAEALRQQGATPDELSDLLPTVRRLSEWPAPEPSRADTRLLVTKLASVLPAPSPVRAAIHAERQRQGTGLRLLLATARTQVDLFGPAFWLVSALVTLVGATVVLSNAYTNPDLLAQESVLRACGPFLAYLGAIVAFRGTRERVLELELVCPPTPAQLALARLVIVLGYDIGLGFALSLALWLGGAGQMLALLLSWFMPLLLVAGLALLLSLRLPVQAAAVLAYGSWLAVLVLNTISGLPVLPLTPVSQTLLGGIGLALLAIALLRLHNDLRRVLPSS